MSKIRRCGTCHFGQIVNQDITKRLCHGAPPSAIQLPTRSGQMTLQMCRPVVSVTDQACALYRSKDQDDLHQDDAVIKQLQEMPSEVPETKQ